MLPGYDKTVVMLDQACQKEKNKTKKNNVEFQFSQSKKRKGVLFPPWQRHASEESDQFGKTKMFY